jgi:multidrug efflux pump subunit AcrB
MLQENPLTVGALAVGVGAVVGLAIPESEKEHEVMGEARDNLVETAQEKAQETQEKVQRVAEEAQSAAKDEAENQGLTQE